MSTIPPPIKPTLLKFWLDDNDDDELTCLFCSRNHCDQSYTTRGNGKTAINGAHSTCVQEHLDKHMKVTRD